MAACPTPLPAPTKCSVRHGDSKPVGRNVMLALVLAVLAGCASLPTDYPRTSSMAMQDHESTPIGRRVAELAAQHPGNSAFRIIRYGRPAFTARVALADLAQKTLDVQYFLWEPDATGRNLGFRGAAVQATLHVADADGAAHYRGGPTAALRRISARG